MAEKKGTLSINSDNIFPIIKKWLYSDHDIFFRELISNGCDAITKLKKLDMMGEYNFPEGHKNKVEVILDPEKKTLKFIDTGLGMTADEVEKYITQIAFSGATQFLEQYKDKTEGDQIIGHFGLGFYSAFMVADEVTIDTLSFIEGAEPVYCTCYCGREYTMATGTKETVGTEISLFLNEESTEFANEYRAREIIEKYCSFMPTEIFLSVEGAEQEFETIPEDQVKDDDVVVVDKPVGVAAHASVGWTGPTVLGSLRDRGVHITSYGAAGREGIVSRLDVGTSGLMLVCKSDLAYTEMRRQFAEHEVKKTYHALVQGGLKENKATIEAPIGRAKVSDFRFCVTPAGKPAVTHWDVLERFGHEATLVSVNLETGRTHQIRVHFSSIGHPLCGDPMYGANPVLSEALGLDRQWLHAMKLEFRHPRTRVWTTVRSQYPADLAAALDAMRARHIEPAEPAEYAEVLVD